MSSRQKPGRRNFPQSVENLLINVRAETFRELHSEGRDHNTRVKGSILSFDDKCVRVATDDP